MQQRIVRWKIRGGLGHTRRRRMVAQQLTHRQGWEKKKSSGSECFDSWPSVAGFIWRLHPLWAAWRL